MATSQRPNKELPTQVQKDRKEGRAGRKGEGGREEGGREGRKKEEREEDGGGEGMKEGRKPY